MQPHKLPKAPPFDSTQQQTSLFVRNKHDSKPWKSQTGGISAASFFFSSLLFIPRPSVRRPAQQWHPWVSGPRIWRLRRCSWDGLRISAGLVQKAKPGQQFNGACHWNISGWIPLGCEESMSTMCACMCMFQSNTLRSHTYTDAHMSHKSFFTPSPSHYHFSPICDALIFIRLCL